MVSVEKRLFFERIYRVDKNITVLLGVDPENYESVALIRDRNYNHLKMNFESLASFDTELEKYMADGVTHYDTYSGITIGYKCPSDDLCRDHQHAIMYQTDETEYEIMIIERGSLIILNQMKKLFLAELRVMAHDGEYARTAINTLVDCGIGTRPDGVIASLRLCVNTLMKQLNESTWHAADYRVLSDTIWLVSELIEKAHLYRNSYPYLKENLYQNL